MNAAPSQPDQMITALQHGSSQAYRTLVREYKDKVFATCISFVRSAEDAEDLTQEVFLEVFRSVAKFRGQSRLSTWIYRISVTKSLEWIRRKNRKKRAAEVASLSDLQARGFDAPCAGNHHPGVQLEQKERAAYLFRAIDDLPENQKVAFTLNKVEGRSYQEVAEIMELSLSSVESLLFRAKKGLQVRLAGMYKKII